MRYRALLLLAILLPLTTLAQEFNAGFVQGLWYSSEPFAEKPVRIYVAIRNHTGGDLTGRVEFLDNDATIARTDVKALDGRIIESWTDWTPTYGSHTITALLSRVELHKVGSSTKTINITSAVAEDIVFVDYDTDGDGVGNEKDIDDDGDGISDEAEKNNGTNPLVFDKPAKESVVADTEADGQTKDVSTQADESASTDASLQGLERYLTPSPAHTALANLSDFVVTTKQNLDTYRENRQSRIAEENEPEEIIVNDDGFGEITRTNGAEQKTQTSEFKEGGVMATVVAISVTVIRAVYSVILLMLSLYLSHPIILQLTLLLAILFLIYKLARRFGERSR